MASPEETKKGNIYLKSDAKIPMFLQSRKTI